MYNRVFKNYQVNVGVPVQIKPLLNIYSVDQNIQCMERNTEIEDEDSILNKAREEAELLIKEAQYEAARLLEEAKIQALENENAIFEEARNKGYEDGINEAKEQCADILKEAEQTLCDAQLKYKEVVQSIESEVINIIMDIARKVIGDEITANKNSIMAVVRQAFEKCSNKENAVIKVSPSDYDFMTLNKDELLSVVGAENIDIRRDSALKEGACVIETQYGSIDGGIETKLNKIEKAFKEAV